MWPDPDKEPLPEPLINSILKRPPNRNERSKITKFTICTPEAEQPSTAGEEGAEEVEKSAVPALR